MALLDGQYNLLDLLLFPTGFFLVLCLGLFDLPYLPLLFLCFLLLTLYQLRFSLSLSSLARSVLLGILHLFFREVAIRGRHKLPPTGPILLACAPHINQFVDPICVLSITDRAVRFLCAAWTFRQPYIGDIARMLNAIPVERAMDIANKGQGRVTVQGTTATGVDGADFVKLGITPGWNFLVKEESLTVKAVTSATTLTLSAPPDRGDVLTPSEYSVAPHIDQAQVFHHVWDALCAGECVGIFPEGGSHDQSAFLPFRAGVAIMALGAMAKDEQLRVQVFPVGLNYFQGWKFRSRVYLDIGDVIVPSVEQVAGYKAGGDAKKAAIAELLEQVHRSLKLVTATAPSYHILHLLWAIRRLYTPDDVRLSVTQKLELTRRLEQYYEQMKDTEEGKELQERVMRYNDHLQMLGLRDQQLMNLASESDAHRVLPVFLQRIAILAALTIAALPGAVLNAPTVIVARSVSRQKAKKAIAESMGVKLEGKDVMATWKVMTAAALIPLCLIVYPIVGAVLGHYAQVGAWRSALAVLLLQLPLMYASVRFVEVGWDVFRSLKPLWFALVGHAGVKELREERKALQAKIMTMVPPSHTSQRTAKAAPPARVRPISAHPTSSLLAPPLSPAGERVRPEAVRAGLREGSHHQAEEGCRRGLAGGPGAGQAASGGGRVRGVALDPLEEPQRTGRLSTRRRHARLAQPPPVYCRWALVCRC